MNEGGGLCGLRSDGSLAPLPAGLQYLIDRGAFTQELGACQMLARRLFGALGREGVDPDEPENEAVDENFVKAQRHPQADR